MTANNRTTVLIIDDSAAVRDISTDMLRLLDFDVLTAVDGATGVAVYQQHKVDLVLLDMNMPEMDGAATYQALRSVDPRVSVIICSSDSQSKVKDRFGTDLKIPPYLHKPFDTTAFLEAVQAMLP